MKKLVVSVIFCLVIFLSFSACDDESGDNIPPIIFLLEPEEGAELRIGSDIHFDMELSDNEMLLSYKVEIHNNFDNHGHEKFTLKTTTMETTAFHFQKSWDVSGQKKAAIHHHEIVIPDNATPGNYHLMVYCTDAAGNESHVARNIVLSRDSEEHEH